MFAVQVRFLDSKEKPETVVLRRLYATIGSRESSHLIIDGVADLSWELRIRRGIGTRFFLQKVELINSDYIVKDEIEYLTFGSIIIEDMEFFIYCIDPQVSKMYLGKVDSQLESLPGDILSSVSQLFPVLYSVCDPKVALSISSLESLFVGRSRKCLFRMESRHLLPEHIEIFQVAEDWYARQATADAKFSINGKLVTDKIAIKSGDRFGHGDIEFIYLDSESDLNRFSDEIGYSLSEQSSLRSGHLILEEDQGKSRIIPLVENSLFTIGRDPSHSLWLDKYFISRLHCTILLKGDNLEITDFSSNGTLVSGKKLIKDRVTIFNDLELDIVLGPGIRLLYKSGLFPLPMSGIDALDLGRSSSDALTRSEDVIVISSDEDFSKKLDVTFSDFQKRTLRQMEESANYQAMPSPFLSESAVGDLEEGPIQVGVSRFLPQIFIGVLILVLSIVFVVIARNIVF